MNDAAGKTLALVAALLGSATDDWWIIAGAALALHGVGDGVRDVDLLLGDRDALALVARLGLPASPGVPDHRFRSRLFAR